MNDTEKEELRVWSAKAGEPELFARVGETMRRSRSYRQEAQRLFEEAKGYVLK